MALIPRTVRGTQFTQTALTGSDSFVYLPKQNQQLIITSTTAEELSIEIVGTAPSRFYVEGIGLVSGNSGIPLSLPPNSTFACDLDTISRHLAGATVNVISAVGVEVSVVLLSDA